VQRLKADGPGTPAPAVLNALNSEGGIVFVHAGIPGIRGSRELPDIASPYLAHVIRLRSQNAPLNRDRPEVTGAVRAVAAALDEHGDSVYREFESGPLKLLDGDSHLGNTFAWPGGRSGLLDWQVIWQGPGLREVSCRMTAGLEPDMRRAHEKDFIARYLEGLKAGGATDVPGPDAAFERYRVFAAEAWDAAAMTVNWPGLQAQQNADAAFRRTCMAVGDLETAALMNSLYR
jgi:hypothetical protein